MAEDLADSYNATPEQREANNEAAQQLRTRVHGSVTRAIAGDANATVETADVVRSVANHNGTAGGSVLATLQRAGSIHSVQSIPGNESSRVTVQTAIREGLLVRDAMGHLQDAPQMRQAVDALQRTGEQQGPPQDDPGASVFDPRADQAWATEIAPLPQAAYDTAVSRAVGHWAQGHGTPEGMATALARDAGMEPAQALQTIEAGRAHFQAAADKAVSLTGLHGEQLQAFYADLKSRPAHLQEALQRLVIARDPSYLQQLARQWSARTERYQASGH